MSVLLCRRADWFQQMARCAMGLGPAGQSVSQCVPHQARAAKPRAVKTFFHFHVLARASARASVPSNEVQPVTSLRTMVAGRGMGGVRSQEADCVCVNERGGSIGPGHAASVNRARALQAGYPRGGAHRRKLGIRAGHAVSGNARGRWSSSSSGFWRQRARCVPFECVAQGCARRQPGCAVRCHGTLRNSRRARHNTQLCSNRPVTEAGLPAEGTAGLHERLVVQARW